MERKNMPEAEKVTVKYDGPADVRRITAADLKKEANIEHDAVEWSKKNRFQTDVSQELADYLLEDSPHFSVVKPKG
jgi:hypothetical protein